MSQNKNYNSYYDIGYIDGHPNIILYPDSGYSTNMGNSITYTFDRPEGYYYLTIQFTPNAIDGGIVVLNSEEIWRGTSIYNKKINISSYDKISLKLFSMKGQGTYSRAAGTLILSVN